VKQYGAMLVKDHGEHKAKAEQVAKELGVDPPTGSSLGAKTTYAKLKLLSGDSFDKSFAKSMVKDHQDDIKEYKKESSKNDAAGKLAKETLPTLQHHLQAAQQLASQKQSSR
jgi:putative membrane protein